MKTIGMPNQDGVHDESESTLRELIDLHLRYNCSGSTQDKHQLLQQIEASPTETEGFGYWLKWRRSLWTERQKEYSRETQKQIQIRLEIVRRKRDEEDAMETLAAETKDMGSANATEGEGKGA